MALRLNDATAIINRTSGLVAASSSYSCCFWYQPAFVSAAPDYIAPLAITDAGYTAWAGIFGDASASDGNTHINVSDGGSPSTSLGRLIPSGRKVHLGYARTGTTHNFYVNGYLAAQVTKNIAAVTFAEMLLGNDRVSVVDAALLIWDFKEWNVTKTTYTFIEEMTNIGTVINTTGLVTYTPLLTDLNDDSGNGNHWSGAGNYDFVSNPAITISNTNPAISAPSLPFAETEQTTDLDLDASTSSMWLYYKYVNTTGEPIVISMAHWVEGLGHELWVRGYALTNDTVITRIGDVVNANAMVLDSFGNTSFTMPLPAGMTMYFELWYPFGETIAPPEATTLKVKTLLGPSQPAALRDVFIRAASFSGGPDLDEVEQYTGLHGGFIRASESEIIGFIPLFPAGETGDVLPTSGRMLFLDEGGSWDGYTTVSGDFAYWAYLYEPDFSIVTRVAVLSNLLPPTRTRTHLQSEKFYQTGFFTGAPANATIVNTIDADGTLTEITRITVAAAGALLHTFAANADESVLFVANFNTAAAIKRFNLGTLTFDADLVAGVTNYEITDMLVLMDGTLVACYFKASAPRDVFVRLYDPVTGATLDTHTFDFGGETLTSIEPRLGYSSNEDAYWILNHYTIGRSDVREMSVDGSILTGPSITTDVIQTTIAQEDSPIPSTSDSCPIIELRAISATPESGVGIIGPLVWWHHRRLVPMFLSSSPDLGGYRPSIPPPPPITSPGSPPASGDGSVGGRGPDITGGAGGGSATPKIIRVTSRADTNTLALNADGTYSGTLRGALLASGPRFVIFEVSGYININSNIIITNPYLTVAGQTAPSPGVCVRSTAGPLSVEKAIIVSTHDSVWQHFRIRPGSDSGNSALYVWNQNQPIDVSNHVLDHMSISWFKDEGFRFHGPADNMTVWRCLIAEGCHPSQQFSLPDDNGHGIAFENGENYAVLQTLIAHCFYRCPDFKAGAKAYVANNVIYGADLGVSFLDSDNTGYIGSGDVLNNYFRRDSVGGGDRLAIGVRGLDTGWEVYIAGNIYDNGPVSPAWTDFAVIAGEGIDPRVGSPTQTPPLNYDLISAAATYETVLRHCGARPKFRTGVDDDGVDSRIVANVRARTGGWIAGPSAVGGYPALANNTRALSIPANPWAIADGTRTNFELWLESYARAVEP